MLAPFLMEPMVMLSGRNTADDNAMCRRVIVMGEFSRIFLLKCFKHKYMDYSKYTLCPRHLDLAIISNFCFTPFFPFLAGGGGRCTMHRMELPRPGTEPAAPAVEA